MTGDHPLCVLPHTEPATPDACTCGCHVGGAFRPACDRPGGCGYIHAAPARNPRLAQPGMLVCRKHRHQMDRLIDDIHAYTLDLDLIREAGTAPARSKRAHGASRPRNPAPPAPANLDWLVLTDTRSVPDNDHDDDEDQAPWSVPYLTEVYCFRLRDERPLTRIVHVPTTVRGIRVDVPRTVPTLIPRSSSARLDMLRRHHDWIAGQEWLPDYLIEMRGLRRALAFAVNDKAAIKEGVCIVVTDQGVCGGALLRRNGEETVSCFRCKARWSTSNELARLWVALEGKTG